MTPEDRLVHALSRYSSTWWYDTAAIPHLVNKYEQLHSLVAHLPALDDAYCIGNRIPYAAHRLVVKPRAQ